MLLCFHYNSACECESEHDTFVTLSFFYYTWSEYTFLWLLLCCSFHFRLQSALAPLTARHTQNKWLFMRFEPMTFYKSQTTLSAAWQIRSFQDFYPSVQSSNLVARNAEISYLGSPRMFGTVSLRTHLLCNCILLVSLGHMTINQLGRDNAR